MPEIECEKNALEALLYKFISNLDNSGDIQSSDVDYEAALITMLNRLIMKNSGKPGDFLAVIIGLSFWDRLVEKRTSKPENLQYLELNDCKEAATELLADYERELAAFTAAIFSKGMGEVVSPIEWLQFAETKHMKIDCRVRVAIISDYYGLNPEIGKTKLKAAKTLTKKELAEKLGMNENDAIQFCLNNPTIGLYVPENIKGAILYDSSNPLANTIVNVKNSSSLPLKSKKLVEVEHAINRSFISTHHQYDYQNYARLVKDGRDAYRDQMAARLHGGGTIKIKSKDKLKLHLPLYDYIIGADKYLYSDKEIDITADDLVFIESEVFPFYKENRLDWEIFYTENNTKIIENLINKSHITIKELVAVFFLKADYITEVIDFFKSQFDKWHQEIKDKKRSLDPFNEILINYNDKDKIINGSTLFKPLSAISMLLNAGLLPDKLKRLPRNSPQKAGFDINPDYYEEYNISNNEDLSLTIKSPKNYCNTTPRYFNYETLLKRWEHKPSNEIATLCLDNKLNTYIVVPEENVITCFENNQSNLSYYQHMNCGNPLFLKRYKGLEILLVNDDSFGFDLEHLFKSDSFHLKVKSHLMSLMALP